MEVRLLGLELPEIAPGTNLAEEIVRAAEKYGGIAEGDIICVTVKIVSKAKGHIMRIPQKVPWGFKVLARLLGKSPQLVYAIYKTSKRVSVAIPVFSILSEIGFIEKVSTNRDVAFKVFSQERCFLMTRMPDGSLVSEAGIDSSNVPDGNYVLLPRDPDGEARELAEEICRLTGKRVAVVLSDTEISISRMGSVDIALGCWGIEPVTKKFGEPDIYGKPKYGGVDLVADEVAAAAALLMGQTGKGVPAVIIRGLEYNFSEEGLRSVTFPPRLWMKGFLKTLAFSAVFKVVETSLRILGGLGDAGDSRGGDDKEAD